MNDIITITGDAESSTSVTTKRGDVLICLVAKASTAAESQALCREHIFNIQADDLAADDAEVEFLVRPSWVKPLRAATLKQAGS